MKRTGIIELDMNKELRKYCDEGSNNPYEPYACPNRFTKKTFELDNSKKYLEKSRRGVFELDMHKELRKYDGRDDDER